MGQTEHTVSKAKGISSDDNVIETLSEKPSITRTTKNTRLIYVYVAIFQINDVANMFAFIAKNLNITSWREPGVNA